MKIQRNLLTTEQIKLICDKNTKTDEYGGNTYCNRECPLKKVIGLTSYCVNDIKCFEQELRDYLNEEVEVIK